MQSRDATMTDCYEVEVTTHTVVFVSGAESKDKAIEYAQDEMPIGANVMEISARQLAAYEVDSVRRHADERSEA